MVRPARLAVPAPWKRHDDVVAWRQIADPQSQPPRPPRHPRARIPRDKAGSENTRRARAGRYGTCRWRRCAPIPRPAPARRDLVDGFRNGCPLAERARTAAVIFIGNPVIAGGAKQSSSARGSPDADCFVPLARNRRYAYAAPPGPRPAMTDFPSLLDRFAAAIVANDGGAAWQRALHRRRHLSRRILRRPHRPPRDRRDAAALPRHRPRLPLGLARTLERRDDGLRPLPLQLCLTRFGLPEGKPVLFRRHQPLPVRRMG